MFIVHLPAPRPKDALEAALTSVFLAQCGQDASQNGGLLLNSEGQTPNTPQEREQLWRADYQGVAAKSGGPAYSKCPLCWATNRA